MERHVWSLVENVAEIALATDEQGRVIHANSAACIAFLQEGGSDDLLRSRKLDQLFHLAPEEQSRLEACSRDGTPQSFETTALARGRRFPVRLLLTPFQRNGTAGGLLAVAVDLSEQKRVERTLQASSETEKLFRKKLQDLYEVNMALAQAPSLDELCRRAVELGRSRLGLDRVGIWFADPERPCTFVGSFGTDEAGNVRDERNSKVVVPSDDPLVQVLNGESPLILRETDVLVNNHYTPVGKGMRATAPLWDGQKVLGILSTDNLLQRIPITSEQGEIIKLFAAGLAHLYSRIRAEQELRESERTERNFREKLQALYEVNLELARCESVSDLLYRAVELGRSRLGFDRLSVWLVDPNDSGFLNGSFGTDENGQVRDERSCRISIGRDSLAHQVLTRQLPVEIKEDIALQDDSERPVGYGYRAEAALWDGQKVLGLLMMDNLFSNQPISKEQAELLKLLASGLAQHYIRKRAEEALSQSELEYRRLIDSTRDWVWSLDAAGQLVFSNKAVTQLLGYSPAELVGKEVYGFMHPEDRSLARRTVQQAIEHRHGWHNILIRWNHKDGSIRFLESTSHILLDNEDRVVGLAGIDRDITDRLQAERALRQERDFADSLINTTPLIVLVLDMKGKIVRYNHFMEELTGRPLTETRGQYWFDIFLPHRDREPIRQFFNRSITNIHTFGNVNPILTANGKEREIEWYNQTIRDGSGQPTGVLCIGLDITERRNVEEQLRQAQKMEAIGQLAGGIAHDFNNQLTVVKGYSEMLLRKMPPSDPTHDQVEEIRKAAARAAVLTGQLLAFSRKQFLRPEVFNINTALDELADPLTRMIGEEIHLSLVTDPKLGNIKADPIHLRQAVMNLVVNARDAMPAGGRLTLTTRNVILDDKYVSRHVDAHSGPYIMLAVEDTGIGISEGVLQRIFEPFFTTKPVDKGTGLGLAMVYGFVKQSGGHITVKSVPGKGTTFRIYLPRVAEDVAPAVPSDATPPPPQYHGHETILLAEDDESVRKLVARLLRQNGYVVLETGNAHEALPLGEHYNGPIDMLISDVVMPGMSGLELANRLRRKRPGIPVLYITGYSERVNIQDRLDERLEQLITKPFQPDKLGQTVRALLDAAAKA